MLITNKSQEAMHRRDRTRYGELTATSTEGSPAMPTLDDRRADDRGDLALVLDVVRSGVARTRATISARTNLGRTAVSRRLDDLIDLGLVTEGALGPSNGGRSPREVRFRSEIGIVLGAEFGATSLTVCATDLSGNLLASSEEPWQIEVGPEPSLARVGELFRGLGAKLEGGIPSLWGVGIGLPGPVEFATGRPSSPPIMPGWDAYPVREHLAQEFDAPVWVDNDVNVMALGELWSGAARNDRNVVVVKIGTGIGAGLISEGALHRGAQGSAGDIGHVAVVGRDHDVMCRCGNRGCLEAVAGGAAIARDAQAAAADGTSPYLAALTRDGRELSAVDVANGAQQGDAFCVVLLAGVGQHIGEMLASIVNIFNPSLVVLGGGVTGAGDALLATIRQQIYLRSSPLATRDLRVTRSTLGHLGGAIGAAVMVIDRLFRRECLPQWIPTGSPVGQPQIAEHSRP